MARDERIYPSFNDPNFVFHLARYLWAAQFAFAREVLDAGCGSGYGTELLSLVARRVHGVDYDAEAIEQNRSAYEHRRNLTFEVQDVSALSTPQHSFDLIVSFEVYEHLESGASDKFVSKLASSCRPDGLVLLSTPNRLVEKPFMHSAGLSYPYHINSVSPAEFRSKLRAHFRYVRLFGQRLSAPLIKRVFQALDFMNLRHRLAHRTKERIQLALTGQPLVPMPELSNVQLASSHVRQSGIIVALCRR
jgi:SAM-dependent methyltransferase